MTKVHAVAPEPGIAALLDGAQFIDAYQISVLDLRLDAAGAARRMFARSPGWVEALMALRTAIVKPFGLKTGQEPYDRGDKIGIFPIESETPNRIVMGFADIHLDFRAVVDVAQAAGESKVTITTLVRLHNLLGRTYLTLIVPFHKLIVRDALKRVAAH